MLQTHPATVNKPNPLIGIEFHDMGAQHDRYLRVSDPFGHNPLDLKEIIRYMCNNNIDLHFFHLMKVTEKMESCFDIMLNKFGAKLYVWNIEQNIDQFLPLVVQSIESSVVKSTWG